jgi:multiple sugar transport system substrate-binding protein
MATRVPTQRLRSHPVGRRAALAALAGLTIAPAAPAQRGPQRTLSFVGWNNALEQVREHIAEFVRASGIRVSHQQIPWATYRAGLNARLRGGTPTDIAWMSDAWLAEFAGAGLIAPIDDNAALVAPYAEMLPFCAEQMTFGGRRYGLPYYTDCVTLICNGDVLAAAGIVEPPETWADLVAQCRRVAPDRAGPPPLLLPLDNNPWLAEILHALAFAFGGQFVDDRLEHVTGAAAEPLAAMLRFLRETIGPGGVARPSALRTDEDAVFQDFAEGGHAFALLPSYRLVQLNDPARSAAAGAFRAVLMPNGAGATGNLTCGWTRFFVMTASAAADAGRRADATAFMTAFGSRDWTGQYRFQRHLLMDLGLPACFPIGEGDPVTQSFLERATQGLAVLAAQRRRLRGKPVAASWFGAWHTATADAWREAIAGRLEIDAAIAFSARIWDRLRAERIRP